MPIPAQPRRAGGWSQGATLAILVLVLAYLLAGRLDSGAPCAQPAPRSVAPQAAVVQTPALAATRLLARARALERTQMAELALAGRLEVAPPPEQLHPGIKLFDAFGRHMTVSMMAAGTKPKIHPQRCDACGICVKNCPAGCYSRATDDAVPTFTGGGCTGCWACYNQCPQGAFSGFASPTGPSAQYQGPAKASRDLFR